MEILLILKRVPGVVAKTWMSFFTTAAPGTESRSVSLRWNTMLPRGTMVMGDWWLRVKGTVVVRISPSLQTTSTLTISRVIPATSAGGAVRWISYFSPSTTSTI